MKHRRLVASIGVVLLLALGAAALAQGDYDLSWWTVDGGGTTFSTDGGYTLAGTAGQPDAGVLRGGGYTLGGALWRGGAVVGPRSQVYLPLVVRNYVTAPDLVVEDIMASGQGVSVVIRNQGDAPVTSEFWVDGYINPDPVPTGPNQVWSDLGNEGMVWGVTQDVLPLQPGATLTLTVGDVHYWPELSHVSWPLSVDAAIYVQVDSANTQTNYGGVLETHEITGAPYNNIMGPVYPTATGDPTLQNPPVSDDSRSAGPTKLPPRQ